jgi:hypothetical protein
MVHQDQVGALADFTGLTSYTASDLWLADARGIDRVTLDAELVRAPAGTMGREGECNDRT